MGNLKAARQSCDQVPMMKRRLDTGQSESGQGADFHIDFLILSLFGYQIRGKRSARSLRDRRFHYWAPNI